MSYDDDRNKLIDSLKEEDSDFGRLKRSSANQQINLICVFLAIACLASAFPILGWIFELLCHFKLLFLIAFALLFIISLLRKLKISCALCLLGIVFNAVYILPYIKQSRLKASSDTQAASNLHHNKITFLHANVAADNGDIESVAETIGAAQADVIGVCELTPALSDILRQKLKDYQFSVTSPRDDNFGIGLFSKHPLENTTVDSVKKGMPPTIKTDLVSDVGRMRFIYTHPYPPLLPEMGALRDYQLEKLSKEARELTYPVVLAGDFNTTCWAPAFPRILEVGGFKDPQTEFGLQPSWPSGLVPSMLSLDHVLYRGTISPIEKELVNIPGSDHKGVKMTFRFQPQ